jgi:hypothetical protein
MTRSRGSVISFDGVFPTFATEAGVLSAAVWHLIDALRRYVVHDYATNDMSLSIRDWRGGFNSRGV